MKANEFYLRSYWRNKLLMDHFIIIDIVKSITELLTIKSCQHKKTSLFLHRCCEFYSEKL